MIVESSFKNIKTGEVVFSTYEDNSIAVANADEVKVEASIRIISIMPEVKQRNAMAKGLSLSFVHGADPSLWPRGERVRLASVLRDWAKIERIREVSNALEMLDPIPLDFKDDSYWVF